MTAIAILFFATITMAQTVPSYVPTSGLVGWWPFTGNAIDSSGNTNNGTVNGATLTTDRFGYVNSAFNFDGVNDWININNSASLNPTSQITISAWVNTLAYNLMGASMVVNKGWDQGPGHYDLLVFSSNYKSRFVIGAGIYVESNSIININQWTLITASIDSLTMKIYVNGTLENTVLQANNNSFGTNTDPLYIGKHDYNSAPYYFNGKIDDIGIWNRALDSCEVKDLYFASLGNCCNVSVTTQPINQSVNISNNAQFTTASSDPLATYQWQTDLGVGFQNLNSVGQYSGTTNDTLSVSNVTMTNNNQPFRCIVSSGSCTDTSAVAVLTVVNNTGINEVSQSNLFSVYPNPANSHINVKADVTLLGSDYTIYDNTGKLVLSGKINSENTVIELGNLSGGIYMFNVGGNLKQTFKVIKE